MRKIIGSVAAGSVILALALTGCARTGGNSTAQATASFPSGKPIEVIVPYDAGGFTDVLARIVAEGMSNELGSPVQVINKPGAGGTVGLSQLAAEKADGLTIGTLNMPSALAYLDKSKNLTYTTASFKGIAGLATSPTVVAVRADSPWKTFEDLVAAAKASPGHITLAGGTNVTSDDALTVAALEKNGVDFNVVTIDTGGADKTTQLLGGQIQVTVGSLGAVKTGLESKQIRLLAVASEDKSPLIPDVPTLKTLGFDIVTSGNVTLAAPAGTPQEYVDILSRSAEAAAKDPDLVKTANAAGYDILFRDAAETTKYWEDQESAAAEILGK
ncbi:tripartite tricarboxylate transporter substrate binding protein [Paenarthrobacter sp. NPDC089989]|uniref:tripartite tricarboxylate transporter substrate binding protein n=1 Tax=unclassified Paenarthrobacter TaxID=2634190 RepID=UPI003803F67E